MNEKKIPSNLKECCEQDSVSANLWRWSENIKTLGYVFVGIIIAVGLIVFIVAVSTYDGGSLATTTIVSTLIIAFSTYITFKVASLLISSLASIVENTAVSAKVALYKANKAEASNTKGPSHYSKAYPTVPPAKSDFVVSAPNGTSTPTVNTKTDIAADGELITCPHCEKKNIPSRTTCWYCDKQLNS